MTVLFIIIGILLLISFTQYIKTLNTFIESSYKISTKDMSSIILLSISIFTSLLAYSYRKDWSIDNTVILMIISVGVLVYILYKNIKSTNILLGLWITIYQITVAILILSVIFLILSVLFSDDKNKSK